MVSIKSNLDSTIFLMFVKLSSFGLNILDKNSVRESQKLEKKPPIEEPKEENQAPNLSNKSLNQPPNLLKRLIKFSPIDLKILPIFSMSSLKKLITFSKPFVMLDKIPPLSSLSVVFPLSPVVFCSFPPVVFVSLLPPPVSPEGLLEKPLNRLH